MDPAASARGLAQALRLVRAARALDEDERPKKPGRRRHRRVAPLQTPAMLPADKGIGGA